MATLPRRLVWLLLLPSLLGCGRFGFDPLKPPPPEVATDGARRDTASACDGGTCETVAAAILVIDDPHDFGVRPVGTTTPHAFSVVNAGGTIATSIVAESMASPFGIESDLCTGSLAPGARCTVVVSFAPAAEGIYEGSLGLGYDDGLSRQNSAVRVEAEASAPGIVTVSPSGMTALPGAHWQLEGEGGTPPYRFAVVSGGGRVTPEGRLVASDAAGTTVVGVVDATGESAEMAIVVVDSIGPTDRMCMGEAFTSMPSGRITDSNNDADGDGDYENLEDCQYIIDPPTSAPVEILARVWEVETGGDYDWLEIHDGGDSSAPVLGHYTGDAPLTRVVASAGDAYLHWSTDTGAKRPGFELVWRTIWSAEVGIAAVPATIAPGAETTLTAVGGVGPYAFQVVSGEGTIMDASGYTARFVAGSSPSETIVRVTDADGVTADLVVGVRSYFETCTDTSSTATRGGLYDSGGSSDPYAHDEDCGFLIERVGGSPITLTPRRFRVEGEGIVGFGPYDTLSIYDGSDTSGALLGVFEGNDFNAPLRATSGAMYLHWSSDSNVSGPGFDLTWE